MSNELLTGPRIENCAVLDLLTSLVDKSMVAYDEATGRYRLLETVRQYARDRILDDGELELRRDRHLSCFLALAEQAEPNLRGADQRAWLEQLEGEHDNLRAALAWSREHDLTTVRGLRLCAALWRFWFVRGYLGEGRNWCRSTLDVPMGDLASKARAEALNGAGALAYGQGDYAAAGSHHEESLAIRRGIGDSQGIANSLGNLGNVAKERGDYVAARTYYQESILITRELGNKSAVAGSLNNLGNVALNQGDYAAARSLYGEALAINKALGNRAWEGTNLQNLANVASVQADYATAYALSEESLSIQQDLGNRHGIATALSNLGSIAHQQGHLSSARSLHERSLAIQQALGDRLGVAHSLGNLGSVMFQEADCASARCLFEQSLALHRDIGDRRGIAGSLCRLGTVVSEDGDYALARSYCEESLFMQRDVGDRRAMAGSLEELATIAARLDNPARAAKVWGAAECLREVIGAPLPPNELPRYDRHVAGARSALADDSAFDVAWQEGRAMTLEQAIEFALEQSDA